jgi:hypothetical protein
MPSIGITLTDIAEPSNATTEEFSKEQSVEVATIRNKSGVTVYASTIPHSTTNFTRRGRGAGSFADVAAGAIAEGTAKIVSIRNSETNTEHPSYEINAIQKDDI